MNRLYVVGNGFDLHHSLPTCFSAFRDFVREIDHKVFDTIEEYLQSLLSLFCRWLNTIDVSTDLLNDKLLLPLDRTAGFLSFNYTDTLQKIYKIPNSNILHIHGRIKDAEASIILGHAWKPDLAEISKEYGPEEEQDTRLIEGLGIVEDYFKRTFKQTERIIAEKESFFTKMGPVREVFVLGHSLSEVDLPYFQKLVECVNDSCKFVVSYYSEAEYRTHQKTFKILGLENVKLILISEINQK